MYNTYFKPPTAYPRKRQRSPSPPRSFVEPLSPIKLRPIEPTFNYPALNNTIDYTVHAKPPSASTQKVHREDASRKRGHHRTPSTIDTLADAALAVSPDFNLLPRSGSLAGPLVNGHSHAHPSGEYPHKRARSEAYPPHHLKNDYTRPFTSYEVNGWPGVGQNAPFSHPHDRRVEEAALLLNFSTTGGQAPTTLTPSNPATYPSVTPRPHANSFPQDYQQQRPDGIDLKPALLPPFAPQAYPLPPPALPSPQRTTSSNDHSPKALGENVAADIVHGCSLGGISRWQIPIGIDSVQQTQTPPEEPVTCGQGELLGTGDACAQHPKKRGWPKGKPRGPGTKKPGPEKTSSKRASGRKKRCDIVKGISASAAPPPSAEPKLRRRKSVSVTQAATNVEEVVIPARSKSVPRDLKMVIHETSPHKVIRRTNKVEAEMVCVSCHTSRQSGSSAGELDEWISCNGCKSWYHLDCAGFKKSHEVRDVDKYFCSTCEVSHGKTTYVRKSKRAHTSVDYAELQRGVLKTSEESTEHHYIQPIKDGTFKFDPETFPRMRPELVTRDFLERSGLFVEPICIPAEWNPRPWELKARMDTKGDVPADDMPLEDMEVEDYEYDMVPDDGQDKLDMVMPKGLTVRQVCNLVGPDTPLDVIDVKTQNSGSKWNLSRWADYYEEESEDKQIRNVISLEVSQTRLGRLLRRPKVVRDIDLQDAVWPKEEVDKGKFPKVQYYCLMSIADSYTDFHIDFGGSSVYYHLLKGKKTFFFIPPKAKHLKAYEEWNESPQQNFTFLPHTTKECYRVDLSEGDTMLIPSGWIHAVWTPKTSLVIGGNFLTRMSFKNQFKVVEIEKNNETPQKFRYPFFQRIMWYTAIDYLETDPLPPAVSDLFYSGQRFERERPIWEDFDGDIAENDPRPGAKNARYYSQAEMEGLPEVANYIFRTVMMVMGRTEGVTADRMKRINASIPKTSGEPLDLAKTFALWVAWKRGNEDPPAWAHPEAILPHSKEDVAPKKLSARAIKELERKEAFAAFRVAPDRQSKRVQSKQASLAAAAAVPAPAQETVDPGNATAHSSDATWNFERSLESATTTTPKPSASSTSMHDSPTGHQENLFPSPHVHTPPAPPQATMMMGAFPGQHISTPKTSVLGPKRVACDTCRKRRIRCKHKDIVIQASPGVSTSEPQNGFHSFRAVENGEGINDAQSGDPYHPGAYFNTGLQNGSPNVAFLAADDHAFGGDNPDHSSDGSGPLPGTNAYLNANIPMAMNGVPIFGDVAKRGRSKACFECRKSKRRCIHDEVGNVDPIKAAETPIPRGSVSSRKRHLDDDVSIDAKNVKTEPAAASPVQGMHGILRPMIHQMPRPKQQRPNQDWTNGPLNNGTQNQRTLAPDEQAQVATLHSTSAPPIDPSLMSEYVESSDPTTHGANSYPYQSQDRSILYMLPSLEQIATEVLDMDGKGGAESSERGLAAIVEFNRRRDENFLANQSKTSDSNGTRPHSVHGSDKLLGEGSVDSGVSLPVDNNPEHQSTHNLANGDATALKQLDRDAKPTQPHLNGTSVGEPQEEETLPHSMNPPETGASSQSRRNSVATIPLYKPPAPIMRSPELTKTMPNGVGTGAHSPSSPGKPKRDTNSTATVSPLAKKQKPVNGEHFEVAVAKSDDAKLALMLRQEEMGLRRR